MKKSTACVYLGVELASYGFGDQHPFGPQRHQAFQQAFEDQQLDKLVSVLKPVLADRSVIELFHSRDYVQQVIDKSASGKGFLDYGDTPAFKGVFEAASYVAGTVIDAVDRLLSNEFQHAFIPIAGLHHARRNGAAGFCAFNDCGIAIEYLKTRGLKQILYVDIDAHHGDGVFYGFEDDPGLIFVDVHESGDYLYPGTGSAEETGKAEAESFKLNIPMRPDARDDDFYKVWENVETFIDRFEPEFILLQCGADSLAGDPITDMKYSDAAHAHATSRLVEIAKQKCNGRLLAMGGGGYNHDNIARAWTAVVKNLIS
ncbi:MAG: acetoin utilization protein AcuC [Gammaproteobacteria bacterium]|nr:acetoin utilization protein AcuC [Gammaproteobacteria bacterium]